MSRPQHHRPGRLGIALLLFWMFGCLCPALAQLTNQRCQTCHGNPQIADWPPETAAAMVSIPPEGPVLRRPEEMSALYVPTAGFENSVHAGLSCTQCHLGIERTPHPQRLAVLACADCHSEPAAALQSGVHAPAADANGRRRPDCSDCHGPAHEIRRLAEPRQWQQAVELTQACIRCHDGPVAETYLQNTHGRGLMNKGLAASATCADCHGSHQVLPAEHPDSPMHPLHVPQTCGRCHAGVADVFYASVHGRHLLKGHAEAATCTSCHHSHGIGIVDEPFLQDVVKECSTCHLELGRTYMLSYHGKATALGGSAAAVCSKCHGAHDIQPAAHPDSRVAPENLVETCGACHGNVNSNFIQYYSHVDPRDPSSPPVVYWTFLVMTTLLLSVLVVFVPHGLLWLQRTFVERLHHPRGYHVAPATERRVRRFAPIHRLTHALIVISFMGLVITGFPLKYSHTDWAHGLASLLGGAQALGTWHRVFAVMTFLYAAIHVGWLIYFFARRNREPLRSFVTGPNSMMMTWKDARDAFAMLRWFLWLGPRPKFDRWAYYEKFDYWGEAWGVFLIGGTGLILWFPELVTRWLPGWILNVAMVIHSIEALLAASVIFLVHFFNTHLRPEKFPVDMVMLTGQMTESEMKEERPAEYERLLASGQLENLIEPPVALRWRILGAIFGILAFSVGMVLIVLIIRSELAHVLGLD